MKADWISERRSTSRTKENEQKVSFTSNIAPSTFESRSQIVKKRETKDAIGNTHKIHQKWRTIMQTWAGATARRCPFEEVGDARPAGVVPDGRDGGNPEGQGEAKGMMEGATGGSLNYVSFMNAVGANNAEISRASIDYIKAREVEAGGEMEPVMLGEESAPLATFWGDLVALATGTEDVMVIGSDPRNSKMYGWELPLNIDCKPALRAVWKMNKKAKEADADAAATLVAKPDQFHVGRGPGPQEGMYMLILENDNVLEVAGMIDAVADPKLALRVDRACWAL